MVAAWSSSWKSISDKCLYSHVLFKKEHLKEVQFLRNSQKMGVPLFDYYFDLISSQLELWSNFSKNSVCATRLPLHIFFAIVSIIGEL